MYNYLFLAVERKNEYMIRGQILLARITCEGCGLDFMQRPELPSHDISTCPLCGYLPLIIEK